MPIDIDDPTSWPEEVRSLINAWASECSGKTEYTNDLPLQLELEVAVRELLHGHLLRAYHYTRLLPHESEMVTTQGLRMLSADLITERIHRALKASAITEADAAAFEKAHVFALGEERYRAGQVCLVLSEHLYERDPEACLPLLTSWGGEALYRSSGSVPFRARLMDLGVPSRVTALIDLSDITKHAVYPSLQKVFVAALLGFHDVGADVFYRAAISPEHVQRIDEVLL